MPPAPLSGESESPARARDAERFNLAVARIATCTLVLVSSELSDAADWAESGRALRAPPAGLEWALPLLDQSAAWVPIVQITCAASSVLALFGIRVRWTLPASAVTAAVLFALPHFSGIPRHDMHVIWFLAVLALCPHASRLRAAPSDAALSERDTALAAHAALVVLRALLACVYFFPGVWKLRESGLDWIFSDNLQNQMFWKWYQFGARPALSIEHHPELVQLGALGVVLFELFFPALMLHRATRALAAASGILFHRFAADLMHLPFSSLVACYVVLIDWAWLWRWLHDSPATEAVSAKRFAAAVRQRLVERSKPLWLLTGGSVLLVSGAVVAGLTGVMQAYPFACYPTFQWRAARTMPDLWISVVRGGIESFLPDSPAHGGVRSQSRWGMAWRAAGVYGEAPSQARLIGYYRTLPEATRGTTLPGDVVRFYSVQVDVTPGALSEPPVSRTLIAEWTP